MEEADWTEEGLQGLGEKFERFLEFRRDVDGDFKLIREGDVFLRNSL